MFLIVLPFQIFEFQREHWQFTNQQIREQNHQNQKHIKIEENAAIEVAKRSRGTPRIAIRIFKRVRDYANYKCIDTITQNDCIEALSLLKIDELGLDDVDRLYITTLIKRFNGGPVGLETLANSIGEEAINLEDVYEPYLLQFGFIDRTPKGRIARRQAYFHYKIMKKK